MYTKFKFQNLITNNYNNILVSVDACCPLCKANIAADYIYGVIYRNSDDATRCGLLCRCPACGNVYLSVFEYDGSYLHEHIGSYPRRITKPSFDPEIETLSSEFIEIYGQAYNAECLELDQIAGIGYRKAVEFLIKDFAITENPDDEESIKSMPLAACINTYIDDDKIKNLATKTVWLGNDETHYIKKHTDRSIEDLKKFIKAMTHFIVMYMIEKDASTIQPM